MSTTIESLEVEIQSNSQSAASGIDALAQSLERLRTATSAVSKGGMGLTSLTNSLKKFSDSVSGLSGLSLAKEQIQGLADALKPLESVQKSGFGSLASGLDKLVKVAPQIDTVSDALKNTNLDEFAEQCDRVAVAITPLATQMEKVAAGFSAFPSKIQRLLQGNTSLSASNAKLSASYIKLTAKVGIAIAAFNKIYRVVAGWIKESNDYQEDLNLFTAAMGKYADSAFDYAQQVSEVMGIDISDWIRNQGVFMTLVTGFGVAGDNAAKMSKNLTQLGYDLSSFFNLSVDESMQKLQSAIAGELEPVRRVGYDLSQAALQQIALDADNYTTSMENLSDAMSDTAMASYAVSAGINTSYYDMTQAEKSQLRYIALMKQVTVVQGDMARTLNAPANQLRIFKAQVTMAARSIGNIFIPALNAILPYAIAVVKAIRAIGDAIAKLFGFEITSVDYSSLTGAASSAGDTADALDDASGSAKKLKSALMGFDELNVISQEDSSGGSSGAVGGGGGAEFELPEYDFLSDVISTKVDEISKKLQPLVDYISENFQTILETAVAIGTAVLAWKLSKQFLSGIATLKKLVSKNVSFGVEFKALGLAMFLADIKEFARYFEDFEKNGATFHNVAGMLSEFAGLLGDAFILFGNLKIGGVLKIVQGVGEIVVVIEDISNNGVNWDNALTAVRGLSNIAIGIGVFTGNIKLAAWSVALQGFSTIIRELADNWDAIKQGDWSGVDKVTLIVSGLEILGGLVVALDVFSKLKSTKDIATAATSVTEVATATEAIDTAVGGGGGLSPKLTSLAKNLGLGVAVIGEVAAAAIIFVGAIAILGKELEQVGIAWEPVIETAGTVAAGIGLGTVILGAVGLAAYGLGTLGTTVALNIGIGTAILLELGVAAGVFIVEIWAIGKGLDEIGKAWQPVLDNGETIATGIGLGTALLVGIGVVTAALGVATVASAGLLPLAIGLGTAILVEMAAAFVLFTESLVAVADELSDNLSPALDRLNKKLPKLTENMSDFVDFMTDFAGEIASYTDSMGKVTWSTIVSGFQKLFDGNPIGSFADDVAQIASDVSDLNAELRIANPELEQAVVLLTDYSALMAQLQILTNDNGTHDLATGMFTNLQTVGEKLVTGFATGMGNKQSLVTAEVTKLKTALNTNFDTITTDMTKKWGDALTQMSTAFSTFQTNINTSLSGFSTSFNLAWSGVWKGMQGVVVTQWNSVLSALERGMNNAIRAVNRVIAQINTLAQFTGIYLNTINTISVDRIQLMADGGFVDEGQLFIAREAGAEMVGGIGQRTAVANNDQIVEGISAGVSSANDNVVAAIYALLDAVENKDMTVNIGDEEVGRSYDRYSTKRGVRVSNGAFANAY